MKQTFLHSYDDIISLNNLLGAWREFVRGKRAKLDVQAFSFCLMDNLFALHRDLENQNYRHGGYRQFRIADPKPRDIHKASVRDRLIHHATHRVLYWFYHPLFISDSYSCRLGGGTHRALDRFRALAYEASRNHTRTAWVLKGDNKKFFASINHDILLTILRERILDEKIIWLLERVISSFPAGLPRQQTGLPLGNLTSQLFVNIYLNEFDQFVKRELKIKNYLRYADDFLILSPDKNQLLAIPPPLKEFLRERLKLILHPNKVSIQTFASGVDFLGWVHFNDYRVLRTATKKRMLKRVRNNPTPPVINSYLGLLRWGNTQKLRKIIFDTRGSNACRGRRI